MKKAQKELKAEGLEKSGDQSYARQEYGKAIEYYTLAQEIYQETELLSKVLGLERKVMNANDKLNPPPQAPATDIDPSYEAAIPFEEGAAANESSDAEVMKEGK